jgi:hypothetical protein
MYDKIKAGAYNNTAHYPSKIEYDKFYVYHSGEVIHNGIVIWDEDERDAKRAEWRAAGYVIEQKVDWDAMNAQRDVYQAEERRLLAQFQADITAHFGLTDHPKAAMLFDKAWARGHGNGFAEVYSVYEDLKDLLVTADRTAARRKMFSAYSQCLIAGENMTVDEIANKLLDAAQ